MKRTRTRMTAALSAVLLVGLGCGDDPDPTGTTPPPGATELTVSLTTPAGDDGAILFTVSGGAIEAPAAASSDHELFFREGGASSLGVALVGDLGAGALLTFGIPEGSDASAYTATIVEVADRANALREDLTGYGLTVSAP